MDRLTDTDIQVHTTLWRVSITLDLRVHSDISGVV